MPDDVTRSRLADLEPPPGPTGVFARYLASVAPEAEGWVSEEAGQRCIAVSGQPAGHLYAPFAWVFGPGGPAARSLIETLLSEMRPPLITFEPSLSDDARTAGATVGTDHLLLHDGPLPEPGEAVIDLDLDRDADRVVESLRPQLPPPWLRERAAFRYVGLERDGQVVALLETTVRDGEYAVIQQVFTDPDRLRQGLATALLSSVVRRVREQGLTPMYIVSSANQASLALADRVGFRLDRELGVVVP